MNVSTQIKALVIQLADIEQVSEVKQKVTRLKIRRENEKRDKIMKILIASILISCLCVTGCATGRVAVLDFDWRTPDQINAFQTEASYPYNVNKTLATEQPLPGAFPWKSGFDFLKVIKGRIRILSFEWSDK